jgi:HNH endonuclease
MAINRDADWLRQKYEIEQLDCVQIAAIVGRNPKTVWSWLKNFGIKTRPRGSNASTNLLQGRTPGFKLSAHQKQQLREARLREGRFPKSPDGEPYWKDRTGAAHPTWTGGATPERQAFYASAEWAVARKAAYANAGGRCQRCGSTDSLHVHHVYPFTITHLRAAGWNLRVLCATCHRFVHSAANATREFLPEFGIYRATERGTVRLIPMTYRPKVTMHLPSWL